VDTDQFISFEVTLQKPGIAWIEFNEPEKLNGMNARKKNVISLKP
jgi:enoyl-CoA hydratase/carnithine racemase